MRQNPRLLPLLLIALLALPAVAGAEDDQNYGFLRVVEGAVTVLSADGSSEPAEPNLPLLTGDLLSLAEEAHVEAILADRTRLRLGPGSELQLAAVAFSADGDARQTRLDLRYGTLQLVVTDEVLGDELPRIDVDNASFYVQSPGEYRVRSDGRGASEIVVRRGAAEVVTERGSTVVQDDEAATVDGTRWASTRVGPAPAEDELERWARAAEPSGGGQVRYVDSSIAYAAADLDSHGSWVSVDSTWAWRPRVDVDWRPYWNGRWDYTPSGLTWVSYDPWGWVPHHYGTWSLSTSYGWVWYPGYTYSPAWVYWYWGDRWAGWCPVGYYTRHYRGNSWRHGFHWGHYGWAGGHLGAWKHWNFSPTHRMFDRYDRHDRHDRRRPHRRGHELERELGQPTLPRGLVTTDTRGLDPERLRQGRLARDLFGERQPGFRQTASELPDVTDFVARRGELPPEVRDRARTRPTEQPIVRGTPFDPNAAPRRAARQEPGWRTPERGARLAERPVQLPSGRLDPVGPPTAHDGGDRRGTVTHLPGEPGPGTGVRERPVRTPPGSGGARTAPVEGRPGLPGSVRSERPDREAPQPALRERPAAPATPDRPQRSGGSRVRPVEGDGSGGVRPDPPAGRTPATPGDGQQNWRFREDGERTPRSGRTVGTGATGGGAPAPGPAVGSSPDGRRPVYGAPAPRATAGETWRSTDRPAARPAVPSYRSPEARRAPATDPSVSGERPPVRRILDGVRQAPGRPSSLTPGPRTPSAPRSAVRPSPTAPRSDVRPAPAPARPAVRPAPSAPSRPPQSTRGGSGESSGSRGGQDRPAPPPRPRGGRS